METVAAPASTPTRSARDFLWLIPAAGLQLQVNGRWMILAAAWLAPIFLLRFMRTQRAWVGIITGFIAIAIVNVIAWQGLIPVHGSLYYAITITIALIQFLPFVIDRLVARRLLGLAASLVLPLSTVAIEFANTRLTPYGSWGALAYTQIDDHALMQTVSVAGLGGVAFVLMWFASVVNAAWESGFAWPRYRAAFLALVVVLGVVYLWGGARLLAPQGDAVRVASLTVSPDPPLDLGDLLGHKRDAAGTERARATLAMLHDSLLAAADREAAAGARIVFWSECNAVVMKSDEASLIARGEALAQARGIYLGMALASFTPGAGYYENLLVIVCPEGKTIARYHKARPVPGDPERGADLHLPVVPTAYGKMAGAICFDGDFPSLMHDASAGGAGLLIIPSSDWRAIDPIHTRMALVRGIENGCAVVRQTNKGLSAAADAQGRILASMDFFKTRNHVMVAQVPTHRVRTIYRRVGDLFSWLCVGGLLIVLIWAMTRRRANVR